MLMVQLHAVFLFIELIIISADAWYKLYGLLILFLLSLFELAGRHGCWCHFLLVEMCWFFFSECVVSLQLLCWLLLLVLFAKKNE